MRARDREGGLVIVVLVSLDKQELGKSPVNHQVKSGRRVAGGGLLLREGSFINSPSTETVGLGCPHVPPMWPPPDPRPRNEVNHNEMSRGHGPRGEITAKNNNNNNTHG